MRWAAVVRGMEMQSQTLLTGEQSEKARHRILLSVVTPAYNEGANLPILYDRLRQVLERLDLGWEWVVVDDHSRDGTFDVMRGIAAQDPRARAIRLARNCGAHTAMMCGLQHVRGSCVVIMAGDLQDPPETLPRLLEQWQSGTQVVWAMREQREGEKLTTRAFARLYYLLMRRLVGIKEMPATGADFFLIDRRVVDALCQFREQNASILALITWMGFRQTAITYDKQARLQGSSGWNLEKKLKLVVDSVTSFTYLPIRVMSYFGFVVALLGLLYAGFVVFHAFMGTPAPGWSSLMVAVLVVGGIQMVMLGVLGEYLWRALDESRHRPRYLIEMVTDGCSLPRQHGVASASQDNGKQVAS
jgi:polyisoprenyl-phosphate glycosyltransferase